MTDARFSATYTPVEAWFDFNDHLNVVGYLHYFVQTVGAYFDSFGFSEETIETEGGSFFALQQHLSYLSEVRRGTDITCKPLPLGCDAKRLHFCVEMIRDDGIVAATLEQMAIYVDFKTRRPCPMPEHRRAQLTAEVDRHRTVLRPETLGRGIAIPGQTGQPMGAVPNS